MLVEFGRFMAQTQSEDYVRGELDHGGEEGDTLADVHASWLYWQHREGFTSEWLMVDGREYVADALVHVHGQTLAYGADDGRRLHGGIGRHPRLEHAVTGAYFNALGNYARAETRGTLAEALGMVTR